MVDLAVLGLWFMAGLDDLKGLSQPKWFYDSMHQSCSVNQANMQEVEKPFRFTSKARYCFDPKH